MKLFRWFYPGMQIKRWGALFFIGLLIFTLGIVLITSIQIPVKIEIGLVKMLKTLTGREVSSTLLDIFLILLGLILMGAGLLKGFLSLYRVAVPFEGRKLVDLVYEKQKLAHGIKIVALGGGTGLSNLLRGLKKYTSNLTAVVTVADDGGSSGRLRKELGVLPPGDIRSCLVALADDESLLSSLLQHRFPSGNGLEGHNFGNLLLVALNQIAGDFEKAVKLSSKILAIKGKVLPATLEPVTLCARYSDGEIIEGESKIPKAKKPIADIFFRPAFCQTPAEVIQSVKEADAIVLGPGSLYTSVLPHLLVTGLKDALLESSALKIYVCNVMTQPGETERMKASDHIKIFLRYLNPVKLDYVLVNNKLPEKEELLQKYQAEGAYPVEPDLKTIRELGVKPIPAALISETELVRHNPEKLAEIIIKLVMEARA